MGLQLAASLPGSLYLFQGEELGLDQVEIPFEALRDPEAIANWPLTQSRDGARTPMPWAAQDEHGGFSSAAPWLPLGDDNLTQAADRQRTDPDSLLNLTTHLLQLRRANPALRTGSFEVLRADKACLVVRRRAAVAPQRRRGARRAHAARAAGRIRPPGAGRNPRLRLRVEGGHGD